MQLQSPQPHGCGWLTGAHTSGAVGSSPGRGKWNPACSGLAKTKILSASLVAQTVKSLPAMRETQVRSLGRGDPLGKRMATHSVILA